MKTDAHGKGLQPGDHVSIPGTVAQVLDSGAVVVMLEHATQAEHEAHLADVEAWKKWPANDLPNRPACPAPPVHTQRLTISDARHVEFHSRPAPGSPIFDKVIKT